MNEEDIMSIESAKRRLRELVGQPVPSSVMENVDWEEISLLSGLSMEQRLSGIARTIRENISGDQNPDKLLLG